MPGDLIAGDVHNPGGYYERLDVVELQEQLLHDLGRFWAGSRGFEPLPRYWRSHPATLRCEQGLRQMLAQEKTRQSGPWAIKDPRSSVLLPLWRDLCRELGIPLQLVLAVRNPEAVVGSVMARDERLAGMTWWRAQQLWWRFNTAVLGATASIGEVSPVVVHYEAWFSDPKAQACALAAAIGLPEPGPKELAAVQLVIRPEHRHQQLLPPEAPPIDRRIQRLYHQLQTQTVLGAVGPLGRGPLRPRRPWRQAIAHWFDWLWLVGSPLLPPFGLLRYRRRFLQGEGCGPLASPTWITRQRPGLLKYHRDPLAWYARCGWKLGISPHPLLDPQRLWCQIGKRKEPVALYRHEALLDDLEVEPFFDSVLYIRQCRDAAITPRPSPLEHYLHQGWEQGLMPHPRVDPLWMTRRHGLRGEPLTALLLAGMDVSDPGLTHPLGNLYGAALADSRCVQRLPKGLVDLVQVWHARGLWPAEHWLYPDAMKRRLPSFGIFGSLPAEVFAAGLQLPLPASLIAPAPPVFHCASPLPWMAQQILMGLGSGVERSTAPRQRLHVLFPKIQCEPWLLDVLSGDWVINLDWPLCQQLASWIECLRAVEVVLDPDRERVALLQLFGVRARHQPFAPLVLQSNAIDSLLQHAQLHLGLPDPRWFELPLELAVLGSTGQANERRWGLIGLAPQSAGVLLLPRLPQLNLANNQDAKALQAWLGILAAHCTTLLCLQPLAGGAVQVPPGVASLGPESEQELLAKWECRCH